MRKSCEVVEIDWTEKGTDMDMDVIAEELQTYKLVPEDNEDTKFEDWSRLVDDDWIYQRTFLDDRTSHLGLFAKPIPWDCPEVCISDTDGEVYEQVVGKHPLIHYKPGWAPAFGHKTMFKFG